MPDKRILIVEDEVVLEGWPLERTLQKAGYKVIGIAETREEAVEIALKERPEIILMDIRLQEDENAGVKAAHEIQEKVDTRIIYLTAYDVSETLLDGVGKTKSFDFLPKPVQQKDLLAAVSHAPLRSMNSNLVFICYSHMDNDMVEEMQKFLIPLAGVGVDIWVDTKIKYGARWKNEVAKALHQAKAAVLLVSIDFVNSKFITHVELPALLKAEALRGTHILPVFVGDVEVPHGILSTYSLLEYNAINSPDKPLAKWSRSKRAKKAWGPLSNFLWKKLGPHNPIN